MTEVIIRPAELSDLDTLLEFEQGIVEAERPYDPTLKSGEIHYYDLKELIKSERAEVAVAELEGEVIGSGYLQVKVSKNYKKHVLHGYIGFMFVRPEHRGKGVIQSVTDHLISWAKENNLSEIKLEVYDENDAAIRAYEKAGFTKNLVEMRKPI